MSARPSPLPVEPGATQSSTVTPAMRAKHTMLAALAVVAAHTLLVWGYPSLWWGDYGRWLHELDRVAHGATPYRDIYWSFPPLAMWLLGGATRVIGSDLPQVWSLTALLAGAIALLYGAVVARVVPASWGIVVAATGMLLGVSFAQQASAPLSLGMYTPAAPVAVLCLLAQLLAFLGDWERPSLARALTVGALGGLGFLAKHDVWFASAWLAVAAGLVSAPGPEGRTRRIVAAGGGYLLAAGAGAAILVVQHGPAALGPILTGFGHIDEYAGMNLPDLAMFTVDVAALGLAVAVTAAVAIAGGAWRTRRDWVVVAAGLALAGTAMAIWLWKAELVERQMIAGGVPELATPLQQMLLPLDPTWSARARAAFGVLRVDLLQHVIPFLAPVVVLALLFARYPATVRDRKWRLVAVLLVTCVALRSRRMVSFVEWSSLMLEVPVYAAAATLLWPAAREHGARTVKLGCLLLAAVAMRAQWQFGYGPLSHRGTYGAVQTPRGRVRLHPGLAKDLAFIRDITDAADPSRRRPILAFGYSGGLSYLTGRPSVDPLTQGFRLSLFATADSAYRIAAARKERLFLVDNISYSDASPVPRFAPWRWMPEMRVNSYQRVDRAFFKRLLTGCAPLTLPDRHSGIFTVFDCATPHAAGAGAEMDAGVDP